MKEKDGLNGITFTDLTPNDYFLYFYRNVNLVILLNMDLSIWNMDLYVKCGFICEIWIYMWNVDLSMSNVIKLHENPCNIKYVNDLPEIITHTINKIKPDVLNCAFPKIPDSN